MKKHEIERSKCHLRNAYRDKIAALCHLSSAKILFWHFTKKIRGALTGFEYKYFKARFVEGKGYPIVSSEFSITRDRCRKLDLEIWDKLGGDPTKGAEFLNLTPCSEEDMAVIDNMGQYGGSFVKALAFAASKADPRNLQKIKDTWPHYWAEYTKF